MYLYLVFGPVGKMFDRNVFLLIQWVISRFSLQGRVR